MAKSKAKRSPPKRGYKPERPVVSVRFDPRILAALKAEAEAFGVSVTEIVHRRLLSYFVARGYDPALTPEENAAVQRELETPVDPEIMAVERNFEWQQEMRRDVEADLRSLGYTRIATPGGALWAEPDVTIPASIVKALKEPESKP